MSSFNKIDEIKRKTLEKKTKRRSNNNPLVISVSEIRSEQQSGEKDELLIIPKKQAKIVDISKLQKYRKLGYSLGAEITNKRKWKTQLWYVKATPNPTSAC